MDYSILYPDIQQELTILRRIYSSLRRRTHKWRLFRHRVILPPPNPLDIHTHSNSSTTIISYDSHTKTIEGYSYSLLQKRLLLKRSPELFQAIQDYWNLLNPFHFKSISRSLHLKVQEYVYIDILNWSQDRDYVRKCCMKDAEYDFELRPGVNYVEFYDGMFELIDNGTQSKLIQEYVKFIRYIYDQLIDSVWFSTQNLNSKLHLKDLEKVKYPLWMMQLLKGPHQISASKAEDSIPRIQTPSKSFSPLKESSSLEKRYPRQISDPSAWRLMSKRSIIQYDKKGCDHNVSRPKSVNKVRNMQSERNIQTPCDNRYIRPRTCNKMNRSQSAQKGKNGDERLNFTKQCEMNRRDNTFKKSVDKFKEYLRL